MKTKKQQTTKKKLLKSPQIQHDNQEAKQTEYVQQKDNEAVKAQKY